MKYYDHKEIPQEYRRAILDQSGENRIHKVTIEKCNEIICDLKNWEAEAQKLMNYEIRYQIDNGAEQTVKVDGWQQAFVELDRVTEYGEAKNVIAVLLQNGRPMRGYQNGRYFGDETSIYHGMGNAKGAERTVYMTNQVL